MAKTYTSFFQVVDLLVHSVKSFKIWGPFGFKGSITICIIYIYIHIYICLSINLSFYQEIRKYIQMIYRYTIYKVYRINIHYKRVRRQNSMQLLNIQNASQNSPNLLAYPIGSMYDIFTYIWLIFMVNVRTCTIHGSYGYPFYSIDFYEKEFNSYHLNRC